MRHPATSMPIVAPADEAWHTRLATPRICFVGLQNLPVLSVQYGAHGIGGEQVQQTLLARALKRRGFDVSMVVADYGQRDGEPVDGITPVPVDRTLPLDTLLPTLPVRGSA